MSGIQDDNDNPPDSPAVSCAAPKRARKESLSEAIGGTAVAIVKALKSDSEEIVHNLVVHFPLAHNLQLVLEFH